MTKTLRNFWLDIALFALLGVNLATLGEAQAATSAADLSLGGHVHVFSGIFLTLICLVHIGLHWQWFRAVLTGKAQGGIKLFMNSMVTVFMLLAGASGHAALTSTAASRFHGLTGSLALVGLFIHSVKHLRWMASVTKKIIPGRRGNISPTALEKEMES